MSKHTEFPTKPDYEAKYKALEQAVKDAIQEMKANENEANDSYQLMGREYDLGKLMTYAESAKILTEKTGISA